MNEIKRYDVNKANMIGLVRFDEKESGQWVKHEDHSAIVAALKEQLSSYSMSAGQADQRKSESDAVRVALGFSADADDVSPSDLVDAIVALQEQVRALAAENKQWKPEFCPVTKRPFFMWIEHPDGGMIPTYGGPYDSYTIPVVDSDGEFSCERYDHDEGAWVDGVCLSERLIDGQMNVHDDASLREIRAHARAEGIHFAANRLLAAWESGFVDDTPAAAHDISGAILSAVEFLPNADEAEFKRDYADEVRARIRVGEQP